MQVAATVQIAGRTLTTALDLQVQPRPDAFIDLFTDQF